MEDIKTPEELLNFMLNNINYGYLGKNGRIYHYDDPDFNNRGIHRFNSYDELLNYQYKKYVEFLKTFNIKDEEINKIIITKFEKPKEHISAEEYLNHVID